MAACDQIVFRYPRDRIKDRSQLIVVARFRDRATDADVVPTTVSYRLDNLTTGAEALDWTTATPGTESTITLSPDANEAKTCAAIQRMQLTVAADYELATQYVETLEYEIVNLGLRGFQ